MWQLRKLSTNEALSEAGPLPNNWGPIFGLHGFQEKIGDLSWIGPDYSDQGWIELSAEEITVIEKQEIIARIEAQKIIATDALASASLTVGEKIAWSEYSDALSNMYLQGDVYTNPIFPIVPFT